jgi:hypothetical protein
MLGISISLFPTLCVCDMYDVQCAWQHIAGFHYQEHVFNSLWFSYLVQCSKLGLGCGWIFMLFFFLKYLLDKNAGSYQFLNTFYNLVKLSSKPQFSEAVVRVMKKKKSAFITEWIILLFIFTLSCIFKTYKSDFSVEVSCWQFCNIK